jgi:putative ABC transport system permease protein
VKAAIESSLQDLCGGSRILTGSPGLSAAAVVLIALVIGGNTTIYSMVHTIVSKPAPGVTAVGLVTLDGQIAGRPSGEAGISFPDYQDYASQTTTVRPLLAASFEALTLTLSDGAYAVRGASVTPNYFDTLGVRLARGRTFTEDEYQLRASGLAAVIGYRLWQDHFEGSDAALGRSILVNGHPATIVGIAPEGFRGVVLTEISQVWMPLVAYAQAAGSEATLNDRARRTVWSVGRLSAGSSLAEARAELTTISARLARSYPDSNTNRSVAPLPYSMTAGGNSLVSQRAPQFLAVLSIVTMLTLAIVCANVANLMLGRVVARQREMAVRLALGASRARILRLVLAEAIIVSLLAWIAACAFAWWVSAAIPDLVNAPVLVDFTPDWSVIVYAMLLAGIGAVTFSVAPAVRVWHQQLLPSLKPGEQGIVVGRSRLSAGLAIVQIALCVLLLTMAGLGYRSVSLLGASDLGFDTNQLMLVRLNTGASATGVEENLALIERLRQRLAEDPQSVGATYVSVVPPFGNIIAEVRGDASAPALPAAQNHVGPGFFDLLGIAITSGREFTPQDNERTGRVAVINQHLANGLWPGESAVGRTLFFGDRGEALEIVGVVANALVTGPRADARPYFVYLPERHRNRMPGPIWFYVRYRGTIEAFAPAVRATLREFDSRIPVETLLTMDAALEDGRAPVRMITALLGLFATGSLVIAAVGLYGVIAFNMRRRLREFGVRLALGASAARVGSAVLREGALLTGTGLVAGFVLSVGVAHLARGLLYGVTPTDATTYGGVFALLGVVSLVASYLPARRAARTDPVFALRQE